MKTGTVAILASCLLGQALAAPVADRAGGVVVPRDGAVNYGVSAKRGDDPVKNVLSSLGLDKANIDKETLKKVEDKVKSLTDASKTPVSRFADLGSLLQVLQPLLDQAGKAGKATGISPPKRSVDGIDSLLKKLGIDTKDLDEKTLKKIEGQVQQIGDSSAPTISRVGGVGGLLDILKPLLAGKEEQSGGVTESAKGLADTATTLAGGAKDAAGSATGAAAGAAGNVAGNVPAKRLVDDSLLDKLLGIVGLDTDPKEGKDGDKKDIAGTASNLADDTLGKATGALGSATKGLPAGGASPVKRSADQNAISELLKSLGLDGVLDSATQTVDGVAGGAASGALGTVKGAANDALGKLAGHKRQPDGLLDPVLDILGLGGDDKKDKSGTTTEDVGGTLGNTADSLTGGLSKPLSDALSSTGSSPLTRRQLDDITGLLSGLLGGKGGDKAPTDKVGSLVGGASKGASDTLSSATGSSPLTRRQLDDVTGLLSGLLGGKGGNKGSDPLSSVTGTLDSTTGGLTKPVSDTVNSATSGLTRRQLDDITGLLSGLLGGGKGGKEGSGPLGSVTDTLDSTTGGITKPLSDTVNSATSGLTRRQLDDVTGLLSGLLSGGKGGKEGSGPLGSVTDTLDSTTGGITKPLSDTVNSATSGLTRRQLDDVTGLLSGLLGGGKGEKEGSGPLGSVTDTLDSTTGGLTKPVSDTVNSATSGLDKRQLEGLTGLLDRLLGTGKKGGEEGSNPISGAVDSIGSTADSLTGGLTSPITDSAGQAAGAVGDAASGAGLGKRQLGGGLLGGLLSGGQGGAKGDEPKDPLTSAVEGLTKGSASGVEGVSKDDSESKGLGLPGLGKRQLPSGVDLASLLQALGPVLDQLKGGAQDAASGASGAIPTPSVAPKNPGKTPAALPTPKVKRQDLDLPIDAAAGGPESAPAPADITPAPLPEPQETEPLTVIFDDLSEVSSLLGQVDGDVPGDKADKLRKTIDSFLSSISDLIPQGMAPGAGAHGAGAGASSVDGPVPTPIV